MPRETRTAIFYAGIVSLGGFLFGFDASVISGVVGFVSREFGLDVWQQRWMNVLSNAGMLVTINNEGTFDYLEPITGPTGGPNPDPQLQDAEALLNVPRFTEREDFVFDGINLNLSFQF